MTIDYKDTIFLPKTTFEMRANLPSKEPLILEECNLHTILNLPRGVFLGAGVLTVVLFFTKGKPTQNIWCYDLKTDRNLGKKEPINNEDLEEFRVPEFITKEFREKI